MTEVFPNYYDKFTCIADKCKHSCCIGWEIDIDEETMELYNSIDDITKNIEGEVPHFILSEGDRCPFLNQSGLCDMILNYGEDYLCDICTLHPRFKNFFDDFEEVGLGLCCEEAARIILSCEEKFKIELPQNLSDEERAFFIKRQEIFGILQEREKSIRERFSLLCEFDFSLSDLYNIYIKLERLDEEWAEKLKSIKFFSFDGRIFDEFPIAFEQLAVYFIFRHLTEAMWDGEYEEKIKFALVSVYLIGAMSAKCNEITLEKISDVARMYSSEIEYSDENIKEIMSRL